jgi:hypothetical protein
MREINQRGITRGAQSAHLNPASRPGDQCVLTNERQATMDIQHAIWVGVGGLFVIWLMIGFWRGLSLKPTDSESRPSETWTRLIPW